MDRSESAIVDILDRMGWATGMTCEEIRRWCHRPPHLERGEWDRLFHPTLRGLARRGVIIKLGTGSVTRYLLPQETT